MHHWRPHQRTLRWGDRGLVCAYICVAKYALIISSTHRYVKFDTFHPAVDRGLPVTRVISRVTLQEILATAAERLAGTQDVIMNDALVADYEQTTYAATGEQRVWAVLQDGRRYEGDILVGADGIWSKVRCVVLCIWCFQYMMRV